MVTNRTFNMGNGETLSTGVYPNNDGTFTALTLAASKTFKTRAGAERWLERRRTASDATDVATRREAFARGVATAILAVEGADIDEPGVAVDTVMGFVRDPRPLCRAAQVRVDALVCRVLGEGRS